MLKNPIQNFVQILRKDFSKNKYLYLLLSPVVAFYLVYHYFPMYGAIIAFKDFTPFKGILGSPWVGFKHFLAFFRSFYFVRLMRNTVLIGFYDILFGFPAPIILALLLNEIRVGSFKRTVQTITYVPHFISLVIVCGLVIDFLSLQGLVNNILVSWGGKPIPFLSRPEWFRFVYVSSGIWQQVGWGSIIYLAAISGISPELYEAARIDGASRWKEVIYITLPSILPTIVILLLLRLGNFMTVSTEKILLLYNPMNYETADVIGTFVYRKGILEASYSYSTAVGLFNSVINFSLLYTLNRFSRRYGKSIW